MMDNNPIVVICTVIGTLVGFASLLLNFYQSGHGAQVGRGLIYSLGLLSLGFFLFAGYRWWEGKREYDLIVLKQDFSDWEEAVKCGSTYCFQAYVHSHPNGKHVAMAQARLQSTTESRAPVSSSARATQPSASSSPSASNLLDSRYQDNGDGTVTDVQTHLQWMRCALGQTWNGETCTGEAKTYQWEPALGAAKVVNYQGGYAGYRDWRMPNREELLSLVYCSSGSPEIWNSTGNSCQGDYARPTIDATAFPQTPASHFWSASPYAGDSDYAWYVYFNFGYVNWYYRSGAFHVRLVRAGQ